MVRILLVCTGNVCRSPMAEGLLRHLLRQDDRHLDVVVESAGTFAAAGAPVSANSVETAAHHGIDLRGHAARPITKRLCERADLILVMEPEHRDAIIQRFPDADGKTHLLTDFADGGVSPLGIADPIGLDLHAYEETFLLIEEALKLALPGIYERFPRPASRDWPGTRRAPVPGEGRKDE